MIGQHWQRIVYRCELMNPRSSFRRRFSATTVAESASTFWLLTTISVRFRYAVVTALNSDTRSTEGTRELHKLQTALQS
jgi:hypothetical protein